MFCIYDLDGTLIDSSHRQLTLPDGALDLNHWRENSTPEKVNQDSLLPLVSLLRKHKRQGNKIIFCTARVLGEADYGFLMDNGLTAHYTLSRPNGCETPDHYLKEIQLRLFAHDRQITWSDFCDNSIMFEDNRKVIDYLRIHGMTLQDAAKLNRVCA